MPGRFSLGFLFDILVSKRTMKLDKLNQDTSKSSLVEWRKGMVLSALIDPSN